MNSKLYFKDRNIHTDTPNLSLLILIANQIIKQDYEIAEINSEGYDIKISFFKNDIDGMVAYENGGKLVIETSNPYECMRLFRIINESIFQLI